MTTNFCVIGSPIEHSLSPVLHTAAYQHLGFDFQYEKYEVEAGGLTDFLNSKSLAGISVTMPLKHEAFTFASRHDGDSILTGAANTLVLSDNIWSAFNTDVYGMSRALANIPVPSRTVVLGSGATARSGIVALSKLFPGTTVAVIARNQVSGEQLVAFAETLGLSALLEPEPIEALLSAELVMSLVPAGSFTKLWHELQERSESLRGILFDVAYNPWPSEAASSWDATKVISGIEMLIWQAIEQIELFSKVAGAHGVIDRASLFEVMKRAVSSK